jgi:hypothetical protein
MALLTSIKRFMSKQSHRRNNQTYRSRLRLESLEERLTPSVDMWVGLARYSNNSLNPNWSAPANWSLNAPPGPSDIAFFDHDTNNNSTAIVDASYTIAGLTLDKTWGGAAGTLDVNNALTVTGNFEEDSGIVNTSAALTIEGAASLWTDGTMDIGSVPVVNAGTLTMATASGGQGQHVIGGTLMNQGTMNLVPGAAGVEQLVLEDGATVNNASTGSINVGASCEISDIFGGVLINAGTITKNAPDTTDIVATFDNNGGSINLKSGTVSFDGGGKIDGATISVASASRLGLADSSVPMVCSGTLAGTGAGTVAITQTLTVASTGLTLQMPGNLLQWSSGTVDVSSGGTLINAQNSVINTSANVAISGAGTLNNQGTINVANGSNLDLTRGASLNNSQGATIDLIAKSLISSNGEPSDIFSNSGLLEKTGSNSAGITSPFNNNGGTLKVVSGNLNVASTGGLVNGVNLIVSQGAAVNLAAGTAPVDYQGAITGNGAGTVTETGFMVITSAGATFKMPGSMFQWGVGNGAPTTIELQSGATLINAKGSTLNLRPGGVNVVGPGRLVNNGTIAEIGDASFWLKQNATLRNGTGATFDFIGNGQLWVYGTTTCNFVNAGTLEKTGGTGWAYVQPSLLNNTGTVAVQSGSLDIMCPVSQIAANTLNAGTWIANGTSAVAATLKIDSATFHTLSTKVILGPNATFTNLAGLTTVGAAGSLNLTGGASLTTAGALTNLGSISLSPGSVLTVGGSFTEASTGTLTLQMGVAGSADSIGTLVSTTGKVTLQGNLNVTSTAVPAVGSSFAIVENEGNAAIIGAFASLAEGATFTVQSGNTSMTFQITYVGTAADGGHNVMITRIA